MALAGRGSHRMCIKASCVDTRQLVGVLLEDPTILLRGIKSFLRLAL